MLTPRGHPYGTKRPCLATSYYETYNRSNAILVDCEENAHRCADGERSAEANGEYELDVIVLAIGFDAFTRALLNMGVVGKGGPTLAEKWAAGPRTYLGIAIEAFRTSSPRHDRNNEREVATCRPQAIVQ
jgi:cation diffusion facilitator CzcD-associated flavoprotein CzcO